MGKERIKLIDVLNDIENQNITITIEDIIKNKKVVEFGTYRGKELTWYVLHKDDKKRQILILSQYTLHCIGCKELGEKYKFNNCSQCGDELMFGKCTEWMQHNFYAFHFNECEKSVICNEKQLFKVYYDIMSKHTNITKCSLSPYISVGCKKILNNDIDAVNWLLGTMGYLKEKSEDDKEIVADKSGIISISLPVAERIDNKKYVPFYYLRPALWIKLKNKGV